MEPHLVLNSLSRNVNCALFRAKLGTSHAAPSNVYCVTESNVCIIYIIKHQLLYALFIFSDRDNHNQNV